MCPGAGPECNVQHLVEKYLEFRCAEYKKGRERLRRELSMTGFEVTQLLNQYESIRRCLLYSEFFETLKSFLTVLNLTKQELRRVLSNSMASRMLRPNLNLVDALKRLMGDSFKLTPKQVVTLVGNGSVACRIESDDFINALKRLREKPFCLTSKQLVTLVGMGSVASRIESDVFVGALLTYLQEHKMDRKLMIKYARKNACTILKN